MSRIFKVYSTACALLCERNTLSEARAHRDDNRNPPAYIEERDLSGTLVRAHSFYPPPEPRPSGAWPEDITQTVAWKHCSSYLLKELAHRNLPSLVGQQLSQLHEPVLEDYCRSLAQNVYVNNLDFWASSLRAGPDASSDEAERCIVDELEGLARRELRSSLDHLRSDISVAIAILIIEKME